MSSRLPDLSILDLKKLYADTVYGMLDHRTGKKVLDTSSESWTHNWKLNTPELTYKYKIGNCYDTSLLSRTVLKKLGIPHKVYHARVKYGTGLDPTHTFVLYKESPKWKWLLGSWGPYMNNTLLDRSRRRLLKAVLSKLNLAAGKLNIIWELAQAPKYGSSIKEYLDAVIGKPLVKTEAVKQYTGGSIPKLKLLRILLLNRSLELDLLAKYLVDLSSETLEYREKRLKKKYADPLYTVFTLLLKGMPVAYGLLRPYTMYKNTVGVPGLYVDLAYRGKGIGTRLLKAILKEARRRKAKTLQLGFYINNPAQHLYMRQGFKPLVTLAYKEL